MRWLVWRLIWGIVVRLWAPGLRVEGAMPSGPAIYAANHNSHADTVVIQHLMARRGRTRMVTAGAEDYFFRTPLRSVGSHLIGVFPFPRSGRDGIDRSIRHLDEGYSVLIYPQGTRGGGPFKPGVGDLAAVGVPVVPVTLLGTDRLLPKGATWPRRSTVRVRFGAPLRRSPNESAPEFAARLEAAVLDISHRSAA